MISPNPLHDAIDYLNQPDDEPEYFECAHSGDWFERHEMVFDGEYYIAKKYLPEYLASIKGSVSDQEFNEYKNSLK